MVSSGKDSRGGRPGARKGAAPNFRYRPFMTLLIDYTMEGPDQIIVLTEDDSEIHFRRFLGSPPSPSQARGIALVARKQDAPLSEVARQLPAQSAFANPAIILSLPFIQPPHRCFPDSRRNLPLAIEGEGGRTPKTFPWRMTCKP